MDFHFWLKRVKKSSRRRMRDRERKRVPDHRPNNTWKGCLPQCPPAHPRNTEDRSIRGWAKRAIGKVEINQLIDWLIDDHLYSAILRSLEQTHCARLWFYMSYKLFIARFLNVHRSGVLKRWHGWCHMKLQPSRHKSCVHHTTMLHVTSCKATYIRCMCV